MYAATLTPLFDEKKAIYTAAATKHDTWQAHNNLGNIFLQEAKKATDNSTKSDLVKQAKTHIDLAANKSQTAVVLNNLAACQLLQGDREGAMVTYEKAADAPGYNSDIQKGINAGRGSIEVRNGNYSRAISLLKGADDKNADALFNLGLAYLVSKDFTNGQQALEAAVYANDKNALAYYCLAIVGSRTGNTTLLNTNLKEAVKLNGSLRDKAINDLEFRKYWEDATFIESLK
jgi:Tfp pilus assembly protein PilF